MRCVPAESSKSGSNCVSKGSEKLTKEVVAGIDIPLSKVYTRFIQIKSK